MIKYELASKCFTSQTVLALTIPLSGIAFRRLTAFRADSWTIPKPALQGPLLTVTI